MKYKLIVVVAVIVLLAAGSLYAFSGFFFKDTTIDSLLDSSNAWLDSETGSQKFPGTLAVEPYFVLDYERKDTVVWLVPLKASDSGLFLGYIETSETSFDRPPVYTTFAEPRESIFKKTFDDAYALMLLYSGYEQSQIRNPVLVSHRGTIVWQSIVYSGFEHIDTLEVPVFWSFNELYNKDGRIYVEETE